MTRPYFLVWGADMLASDQWREATPIMRGAILTLWVLGSVKSQECRWDSIDRIASVLRAERFRGADELAERLLTEGWIDVDDAGEAAVHNWGRWQPKLAKTGAERTRMWRERQGVTDGDEETSQPSRVTPVTQGEERRGEEPLPGRAQDDPILDAYSRFYTSLTPGAIEFLDKLEAEFGNCDEVARAIGEAGKDGRDNLLSRAQTILRRNRRAAKRRDKDAERRELIELEQKANAQRSPVRPLRERPAADVDNGISLEEFRRQQEALAR